MYIHMILSPDHIQYPPNETSGEMYWNYPIWGTLCGDMWGI